MTLISSIQNVRREGERAAVVLLDLGGAAFPFTAGQAVMAGLADRPDRKPYSIACSPAQARESGCLELLVKVDQKGRAGRHLGGLEPGLAVAVEGPMGRFTLDGARSARRLLFVAGGTGIAPLRSMMHAALAWDEPPAIAVVYSARTPDDLVFRPELLRLHAESRIRLRQTVTRAAGSDWKGLRRRIDRELLAEVIEPSSTVCLVCGPDSLVQDVPAMLRELGVPPDRIRREEY